MIQSPALRAVLAAAALLTAGTLLLGWNAATTSQRVAAAALSVVAVAFAGGMLMPRRGVTLLRLVAGVVSLAYVAYAAIEVAMLLGGERQQLRLGHPSAVMSMIGVLLLGIPLGVYALSGRTPRQWGRTGAAEAERQEEQFIALAAARGLDLALPLPLAFLFRVPTLGHANSLARVAAQNGHQANVAEPEEPEGEASCRIVVHVLLTPESIARVKQDAMALARPFGGLLDGWEVRVDEGGGSAAEEDAAGTPM